MNRHNAKAFAEVTALAGVLFVLPVAYYYGRPYLLRAQDTAYDKLFKIDEAQYKKMKELQRQAKEQELELIQKAQTTAEPKDVSLNHEAQQKNN